MNKVRRLFQPLLILSGIKLAARQEEPPDENWRVLIKKGPVLVETSLKELEDSYERKPEWQVIEKGKVLSIPLEELRMQNPPQPDCFGQLVFQERPGRENQIDSYSVAQTCSNMNASIQSKYDEEKEKAKAAGVSESEAEKRAFYEATQLPQFLAVTVWQDILAEIKLKSALEKMMATLKVPAIIIRSVDLKKMSALNDLGLKLPGDAEIDIVLAYVSGDVLHVVIFEVKRRQTYPWQTVSRPPTSKAAIKAEKQLKKDADIMMAVLAGVPADQVILHTLACYPDTSISELQTILCEDCLENGVIYEEVLKDLSFLQKKTQVPDKPEPATTNGKHHLLTFGTRCLAYQSILHVGNREMADQEHLVMERHKFNIQTVDGRMLQNEFVMASPQQQQVIASFTASSLERHLVLTGEAGTGKSLVALQVVNNIIQSLEIAAQQGASPLRSKGPVLVVSAQSLLKDSPLLKHLDVTTKNAVTKIFGEWSDILEEYTPLHGLSRVGDMGIVYLIAVLHKIYEGRPIVILLDEILIGEELNRLADLHKKIPLSVRLVLVVNPFSFSKVSTLPESFLRINLTTPYRSTIAITALARFIAKCEDRLDVPDKDCECDDTALNEDAEDAIQSYMGIQAYRAMGMRDDGTLNFGPDEFVVSGYEDEDYSEDKDDPEEEVDPEDSEAEIGSDVQGTKPMVFDVGEDEVKLREALQISHDLLLGASATLLYARGLPTSIEEVCRSHGKNEGGMWECYSVADFYGWEADRVVAVLGGNDVRGILELLSRAKTHMTLILVKGKGSEDEKWYEEWYTRYQNFFEQAAERDLLSWGVLQPAIATAGQ